MTDPGSSDIRYQDDVLPHVSRTFALTIPQLPVALRASVTNAYLLCRIADTIEDEPALSPAETLEQLQLFKELVAAGGDPQPLARALTARLSDRTLPAERDLVANMDRVLRVTASLGDAQRAAIQRCVALMCDGMPRFQSSASLRGLPRLVDLDDYCYYVAGVVGEMLTELFCAHDPAVARNAPQLRALSTSFAQGLQMTNILKDVWEDRSRGACWLPRELFSPRGVELATLRPEPFDPRFADGMRQLLGIANAHLRNALDYTLFIPRSEPGIRRFCLWAVGLAVLTLQKIHRHPAFTSGAQVKISRSAVRTTRNLVNVCIGSDLALRALFGWAARGLPLETLGDLKRPHAPATAAESADSFAPRRSFGGSAS